MSVEEQAFLNNILFYLQCRRAFFLAEKNVNDANYPFMTMNEEGWNAGLFF